MRLLFVALFLFFILHLALFCSFSLRFPHFWMVLHCFCSVDCSLTLIFICPLFCLLSCSFSLAHASFLALFQNNSKLIHENIIPFSTFADLKYHKLNSFRFTKAAQIQQKAHPKFYARFCVRFLIVHGASMTPHSHTHTWTHSDRDVHSWNEMKWTSWHKQTFPNEVI